MRWGLVPFWSSDQKIGYSTNNAKRRLLPAAPRFGRRSYIAAAWFQPMRFYEWRKLDAKTGKPFAIALKSGDVYTLAGVWERWRDPKSRELLDTFAVITTEANELLAPLHDRMLAIFLANPMGAGWPLLTPPVFLSTC